jgi:cobalt/nickel transport system permease protein
LATSGGGSPRRGRRAATAGRSRSRRSGALAGSLLLRTAERAERIYAAMRARGFEGSFPAGRAFRFGATDAVFVAATAAAIVALRAGDLPRRLGAWLLGLAG